MRSRMRWTFLITTSCHVPYLGIRTVAETDLHSITDVARISRPKTCWKASLCVGCGIAAPCSYTTCRERSTSMSVIDCAYTSHFVAANCCLLARVSLVELVTNWDTQWQHLIALPHFPYPSCTKELACKATLWQCSMRLDGHGLGQMLATRYRHRVLPQWSSAQKAVNFIWGMLSILFLCRHGTELSATARNYRASDSFSDSAATTSPDSYGALREITSELGKWLEFLLLASK